MELYLQWQTNSKSCNDLSIGAIFSQCKQPLNPHLKVTPILDAEQGSFLFALFVHKNIVNASIVTIRRFYCATPFMKAW